ncbi:DUF305 domain-containing protein [Spirosoma arcticum]
MKSNVFVNTALSAVLFFTQSSLAQESASNAMMKSMQSAMTQMMNMKMSGDPDHNFASMMKLHHQGAVYMADLEIKQGANAKTKALASTIKATNQKEIKALDQFLSSHKPMSTSAKMDPEAMKAMHAGSHSMNGKTDHDFASMMAQHHQQAVEMSRAFLKKGKTQPMKTMASAIIKQQTKEIAELKRLEASLKG